ncbi:MAG: ribosome maturation factor RimP [Nitrospirae bacterium]|nr:ribosome maturation factor RimP [Nitrospirota bacterium]
MEDRIREIIEPVVNSMGIEVDNIELAGSGRRTVLRVFIDKEGGVTIEDCERVSREIEAHLDVADPIASSYTLEVSSPGLDRPLRKAGDFKKFVGKAARVITQSPIENQTFFIGEILEAGDDSIVMLLPKDKKVTIPHTNISRARLEVTD